MTRPSSVAGAAATPAGRCAGWLRHARCSRSGWGPTGSTPAVCRHSSTGRPASARRRPTRRPTPARPPTRATARPRSLRPRQRRPHSLRRRRHRRSSLRPRPRRYHSPRRRHGPAHRPAPRRGGFLLALLKGSDPLEPWHADPRPARLTDASGGTVLQPRRQRARRLAGNIERRGLTAIAAPATRYHHFPSRARSVPPVRSSPSSSRMSSSVSSKSQAFPTSKPSSWWKES